MSERETGKLNPGSAVVGDFAELPGSPLRRQVHPGPPANARTILMSDICETRMGGTVRLGFPDLDRGQ